MVTVVSRYNVNKNIYAGTSKKKTSGETVNVPINGHAQRKVIDKSRDGKFSVSEAAKNFGKGFVSPVTNMFSSPKNFAIGVATMGGCAALIAATGGAAAPVLVAAGVAMGAVQAGTAAYKIATAKNGDDVEKAFYDIGGATSTILLSETGAKPALKSANVSTRGLKMLGATKKCIQIAPKKLVESGKTIISGYYIHNLKTSMKTMMIPSTLIQAAKEIAAEKKAFMTSFEGVKSSLPAEFRNSLTGRSKGEISILSKLVKKRNEIKAYVKKVREDELLSENEKKGKIETYLKKSVFKNAKKINMKNLRENNYDVAADKKLLRYLVEDQHGMRLVLEKPSPANTNKIITNWVTEIKKGNIKITEIENYYGKNQKYSESATPYFSEEQITKLNNAMEKKGVGIRKSTEFKKSGYSCVQIKIQHKEGQIMELQIRGKHTDKFAEIEHLPYDLSEGKDISRGNNQIGLMTLKYRKAIRSLNPQQSQDYKKHMYDNYMVARKQDAGVVVQEPEFPKSVDSKLSPENLHKLAIEMNKLPTGMIKKPVVLRPQLGLFSVGTDSTSS